MTAPNIDWHCPPPRSGFLREWDTLIGPGADAREQALVLVPALLAPLLLVCYAIVAQLGWAWWQLIIAVLLTADLIGGVVANATGAAKRWYHRPGQTRRQHLTFQAVHLVQLGLVAAFFPTVSSLGVNWPWLLGNYAVLLGCSWLILTAPIYLQRPLALTLAFAAIVINLYAFAPIPGFEWFPAAFYLKLLVGHVVHEEPYRPNTGD